MARPDASILGDFKGRIENLVVYKLHGKTIIRMRPAGSFHKKNPRNISTSQWVGKVVIPG